jgi:hypothetical protein
VADKIPASHSDVTLPLEEAFSSRRELAKGCTFFIALVGTISAINGLTMLIVGKSQGRAVLLFSGAVWLLWIGLRAAQKIRERAQIAQPAGQIRLTSSEIAVPKLSGEIETVRWMDLREVRLTCDTAGTVYYEFYAGNETPSIVLTRSRVKNPEVLDRELERRTGKVKQTFDWSAWLSRLLFRKAGVRFHPASVLICRCRRRPATRCAAAGAFFSRSPSSSDSASRFRVSQ